MLMRTLRATGMSQMGTHCDLYAVKSISRALTRHDLFDNMCKEGGMSGKKGNFMEDMVTTCGMGKMTGEVTASRVSSLGAACRSTKVEKPKSVVYCVELCWRALSHIFCIVVVHVVEANRCTSCKLHACLDGFNRAAPWPCALP